MNALGNRPSINEKPSYFDVDFQKRPFTVAWEITRACALRCLHCRAEAQTKRHPGELTTEQGMHLIDQIWDMKVPVLVMTGGDPMLRKDLFDLVNYATSKGQYVSLSPSATKLVTGQALRKLHEAGLKIVHISLDGFSPETHDAFRGFRGSYNRTMEIIRDMREEGIPFQIGTTVSKYNYRELPKAAEMVSELGVAVWSVFFLVSTGRGKAEDMVSPQQHEDTYHLLYDLSLKAKFRVRTTAAPAYRRVVIQEKRKAMSEVSKGTGEKITWEQTGAGYAHREGIAPQERGVNDGDGFAFVDHLGNVCPSGFLPLPAGNVKEATLADIYRNAPLFRQLRDKTLLKGNCGICEFKQICGGSRGRAYALTGDYLASEPTCVYKPKMEV